jgi:formate-dependent nitrite reductase membrane component NrfD
LWLLLFLLFLFLLLLLLLLHLNKHRKRSWGLCLASTPMTSTLQEIEAVLLGMFGGSSPG